MKNFKAIVITLMALLVAVGVYTGVQTLYLNQKSATLSEAHDEALATQEQLKSSLETIDKLNEEEAARTVDYEAVLELRPAFIEEIKKFKATVPAAEGKASIDDERKAVMSAQASFAKLDSPKNAENLRVKVASAENAIRVKVKAYDDEQARIAAAAAAAAAAAEAQQSWSAPAPAASGGGGSGGGGGGGDWFGELRGILNSVGGGHVSLTAMNGSSCGAPACASFNGITVNSELAGWSYGMKVWAMTHELAHMYQFAVWDELLSSQAYAANYGTDIERMANCMAALKGANPYGLACSAGQNNLAANVWAGRVG